MYNALLFKTAFADIYSFYIQKAAKKGRAKEEVDAVIGRLQRTNFATTNRQKRRFRFFFAQAPQLNPNVSKIAGFICGYRVEAIEDKLMQKIRHLDKLIDELAKGKSLEKF